MIVYGNHDYDGYKTSSIIGMGLIHSRDAAVKRPASNLLRELTSENREFLKKAGLNLIKKKKKQC